MIIQVNTDKHVPGDADLIARIDTTVRDTLQHRTERLSRVEVHLSDENGAERAGPDDKRCRIEARIAGRQPITVSHVAATVDQSVTGAAGKLKRSLDSVFGRLESH